MSAYRFYPLADYPRTGIVTAPEGRAFIASFYTVEQARAKAQQLREAQA